MGPQHLDPIVPEVVGSEPNTAKENYSKATTMFKLQGRIQGHDTGINRLFVGR